jgi:pimeloyl-ACP methyl ester carboxylesterase
MDGTGRLFGPLLQALGGEVQPQVVAYPPDVDLAYDDLAGLVRESLPSGESFVILAESFSGPVALKAAACRPPNLAGLILCASFVVSPVPRWLRFVVSPALFRFGVSPAVLRFFVLNGETPRALAEEAAAAVRSVAPAVLADRLQAVLKVNVAEALRSCAAPILYMGVATTASSVPAASPASAASGRTSSPWCLRVPTSCCRPGRRRPLRLSSIASEGGFLAEGRTLPLLPPQRP